MKNLKDQLNENLVNESATMLSLLAATTFFSAISTVAAAASRSGALNHFIDADRSVWQVIKDDIAGFFKDKKLKKIAEKYKDDPDVIEYVKYPKKPGWRKMLSTKLEPEEIEYINSLTRNYFK